MAFIAIISLDWIFWVLQHMLFLLEFSSIDRILDCQQKKSQAACFSG